MDMQGKTRVFTLYFQETPADEKWIDAFSQILFMARKASAADWRLKHSRCVNEVFLDIYGSGIYIDTIEDPRVAVFLDDEVSIEEVGRNKKKQVRRMKSWGRGGKTAAQLKRKLLAMLKQVAVLVDQEPDLAEELEIERADVMGLLGFVATQDPEYIETCS